MLIGEIRRALGDDPVRPRFIRSLVKRGYIFIAPVVEASVDLAASSPSPIFVGREAEMERLLGALDEAAASQRQVVFVTGDAGIGKTALCEAFLRVAATRHAMRATWAQCMRLSGPSEPYYPLLDLLTRLARSTDDEPVAATLARHAPSWLPHLPALSDDPCARLRRGDARGHRCADAARDRHRARSPRRRHDARPVDRGSPVGGPGDDRRPHQPRPAARPGEAPAPRDHPAVRLRPPPRHAATDAGRSARAAAHVGDPAATALVRRGGADTSTCSSGASVSRQSSSVLYRLTGGNPLFLVTAIDHLVRKGHFADSGEGWQSRSVARGARGGDSREPGGHGRARARGAGAR